MATYSYHIANLQPMQVNETTGALLASKGNKSDADFSYKTALKYRTEFRIIEDTNNANTANCPTLLQYLTLEGAAQYQLVHLDQYTVVTMKTT